MLDEKALLRMSMVLATSCPGRPSHPSGATTMLKANKVCVAFLGVAAAGFFVTSRANVIPNGNFATVGPSGNPVTVSAPGDVVSAAADWYFFLCDPGSTATSSLVPTTDPHGSGNMMDFTTNGGFYESCGNGLFTNLTSGLPLGSTGSFDIDVSAGTTGEIGFVNSGGAFDSGSFLFAPTSGWETVTFTNQDSPTGEVGFEIFSDSGGTILLDNGIAPIPEPGTVSLLAVALLSLGAFRRRATGLGLAGVGFLRRRKKH
ncbi:MAG: PEP-CTERM sorting domain-containing protein [Steroidobacteraceae bacterium]